MDRYDDVTRRIEKSMSRDWLVAVVALVALVGGSLSLAAGYSNLGKAVSSSRCRFHSVARAEAAGCPVRKS